MTRADPDPAAGWGASSAPDDVAALLRAHPTDPRVLRFASGYYRSRRDYSSALDVALRMTQIDEVAREGQVRAAEEFVMLRRFDEADAALTAAEVHDAGALDSLQWRSNLLRARHERAGALEVARAIVEHHPERSSGYLRAAQDLVFLGRGGEARALLDEMPARVVDNSSADYADAVQKAYGIADAADKVVVRPHNPASTGEADRPGRYLFVSGLPRSGTSALGRLLNLSTEVALYTELLTDRSPYAPSSFDDAFVTGKIAAKRNGPGYQRIYARSAGARWIGDKRPHFLKFAPATFEHFDGHDVTVVHIVRSLAEVALSYEARASNPDDRFWSPVRNSDEAVADAVQSSDYLVRLATGDLRPGHRVLLVPYEGVFAEADHALALYDALGLTIDATLERRLAAYLVKSAGVMGRARTVPEWMQRQVDAAERQASVAELIESVSGPAPFVELSGAVATTAADGGLRA